MEIQSFQWNNPITQSQSVSGINLQNATVRLSSYDTQTTSDSDDVTISEEGKQMAHRMQRMRRLDPEQMKEQVTAMEDTVASLGLEDLDLDSLSREELEAKVTEIGEAMSDIRPEGAPEQTLDLTELEDDQLKSMISGFSNHAEQLSSRLETMESVASGDMPQMSEMVSGGGMKGMKGMGPRGGGGMRPMGGMQQAGATEETEETEESEETDLIDALLQALEEDSEDEESNNFMAAIYSYMESYGSSI